MTKKPKRTKKAEAALIKIAKQICVEYLDAGGFNSPDEADILDVIEVDENGNVWLTVRVVITDLDIEVAERRRKSGE